LIAVRMSNGLYETTINHFYEKTTCVNPVWVWQLRYWSFCASRSATSVRPRSCDPEIRTARYDGDGPRPRCSASEKPFCSSAGFSCRHSCRPASCKFSGRECSDVRDVPWFREATFGSSIILFLRTHCAIDFPRVSSLYFRSSH